MIELLVVVAMIAILIASLTTSVSAAQQRARIQKATNDVKVMSQAILAYENYSRGKNYKLEPMNRVDANKGSLGFLLGFGQSADSGGKVPVLLMSELRAGGDIRDPWGTPYKVTIKKGSASVKIQSATGSLTTGYYLPNFYRLSPEERQ